MALVTKIRKRLDIPHEDGEWIEIQKLSWRQLEDAQETAQAKARASMNEFDPGIFGVLRSGNREEALRGLGRDPDAVAEAAADPMTGYDRFTLLRHGLRAWSYDAELNDAARGDLDEETAGWAAREILRLAKPELFADGADGDDDPKNGLSGISAATSFSSSSSTRSIAGATTPSS